MSTDYHKIPCAEDLLQSIKQTPHFQTGNPSANVLALLDRLETADPNSPEIQEDDANANWGHHQFAGSSLTISTALESWASIGTTAVACRLIAASIKTCKVARYVCLKRQIKASSYLSDAYLENLLERLWSLWQQAGAVCFFFVLLALLISLAASRQTQGRFHRFPHRTRRALRSLIKHPCPSPPYIRCVDLTPTSGLSLRRCTGPPNQTIGFWNGSRYRQPHTALELASSI